MDGSVGMNRGWAQVAGVTGSAWGGRGVGRVRCASAGIRAEVLNSRARGCPCTTWDHSLRVLVCSASARSWIVSRSANTNTLRPLPALSCQFRQCSDALVLRHGSLRPLLRFGRTSHLLRTAVHDACARAKRGTPRLRISEDETGSRSSRSTFL